MKKFFVVIPARLKSTRLPNKPLIKIKGKELILRTYEQCVKAVNKKQIIVATDSQKILNFCKKNNINGIITSKKCLTGTDRVAQVAKKIKADFYINLQGDEPFFNPKDLKKIINYALKNPNQIVNGYSNINDKISFRNPSIPKVVFDKNNYLIYMSRAAIPTTKKNDFKKAWRQICVYSFPRKVLLKSNRSKKTPIEQIEDIEILNFIENGYKVKMLKLSNSSLAIDTPQDLKKAEKLLK
jgi:3-deoxy-manno-octulosonate cytidylyltransferase (CMP-KDO synthetase)|tara:strand:+ start:3723 stop:4442 length:720 start_codon:yes stop_codon:yes gene_type:complete